MQGRSARAGSLTSSLQALCDYLIYHEHNPRVALELSALATVQVGLPVSVGQFMQEHFVPKPGSNLNCNISVFILFIF